MNHVTPNHLTEDQIDDLLIGDLAAEPAAHLAACDPCQERVAAAGAPIANFKAISLAWSERRSATLPAQLARTQVTGWSRYASLAATASAVLVAALIVPIARHEASNGAAAPVAVAARASSSQMASAAQPPSQPALVQAVAAVRTENHRQPTEQIQRDNQMLEAIHLELDASVQSPADVFGADSTGSLMVSHKRNAPLTNLD